MTETRLPSAFAELEPYAEKWCLATEAERWNMRMTTPMLVMREFYGAFVADRSAVKGLFITTSSFSAQAREFVQHLPIELVDGAQLKVLLVEHMTGPG